MLTIAKLWLKCLEINAKRARVQGWDLVIGSGHRARVQAIALLWHRKEKEEKKRKEKKRKEISLDRRK